ncbi:hypothetical protein [Streptomyces sp.]|uniref:hypothetical protein n=1 Tax=Streptomyces sp. TaxID=1931 RepID=UPI002811C865|nr:hypothetical protein [Streptomyces sp.]
MATIRNTAPVAPEGRQDPRRRAAFTRVAVGALLAAAVLSGCGATAPREDGARRAAGRFTAALAAQDFGAACGLLAPGSREELTEDGKAPCDRALRSLELPSGGGARAVEVHGRQALLRTDDDTVFLSQFDEGWRVTAAGCVPQPDDLPYRCSLKGA